MGGKGSESEHALVEDAKLARGELFRCLSALLAEARDDVAAVASKQAEAESIAAQRAADVDTASRAAPPLTLDLLGEARQLLAIRVRVLGREPPVRDGDDAERLIGAKIVRHKAAAGLTSPSHVPARECAHLRLREERLLRELLPPWQHRTAAGLLEQP
jgi:hypothetical protein